MERQPQQEDGAGQTEVAAHHEDVAVGEVDHGEDAVNHGVTQGDEGVDTSQLQGVQDILGQDLEHGGLDLPVQVSRAAELYHQRVVKQETNIVAIGQVDLQAVRGNVARELRQQTGSALPDLPFQPYPVDPFFSDPAQDRKVGDVGELQVARIPAAGIEDHPLFVHQHRLVVNHRHRRFFPLDDINHDRVRQAPVDLHLFDRADGVQFFRRGAEPGQENVFADRDRRDLFDLFRPQKPRPFDLNAGDPEDRQGDDERNERCEEKNKDQRPEQVPASFSPGRRRFFSFRTHS